MTDEVVTELLALGSATLGECGGHTMMARIKPVWAGAAVAGPALTARCASGDNLAIHVAVARAATPGAVLVVDASVAPELGYWGEVLTTAAEAHELAGLVIDGGVRDVSALEAHGFPVFSSLIALAGASKLAGGSVGLPVSVGGVTVTPGDWIVGDVDGVVVIAADSLDSVLAAARSRASNEQRLFVELRDGATTVELLGLDPTQLDEE
ncbi:MAG: RraA family protein [Microthrixaceae bacterium]